MKKKRYKRGLAVLLVVAIAALLCLSAPLPVRAFNTSISVAESPSSNTTATTSLLGEDATIPPTTYLLGQQVSLPAYIEFDAEETKNFQSVQLILSGPEFGSTPFIQDLPLTEGNYSYPANANSDNASPGVLDVVVTWDTGIIQSGYGYTTFGYGYGGYGDTAKIDYDIQWTPPYYLTNQPTPPPPALPGGEPVFNINIPFSLENQAWPAKDSPQGLAYDSANESLYIILPANYWDGNNYKDVIIITETDGAYIDYIVSPGNNWETEGLTFVDTTLYAAYNTWDPETFQMAGFVKKYSSGSWTTIAGLSNLQPIGGLASDGTYIYVAYRDQLRIDKRDPTTGAQISSFDLSMGWGGDGMGGPPIWGFDCLAYDSDDSALYAGQMDCIVIVDANTGDVTDDFFTGMWDTRGLTFVTEDWGGTNYNILYKVNNFWQNGQVSRSSKPGAVPSLEKTPVGSYTAQFKVVADGTTYTENSSFNLDKLTTAPEVTISAPSANFVKGAGQETITVSGSINDPSISTVTVGIALPTVTAFEDDVENEAQTQGYWEHLNVAGIMQWGPPYSQSDLWHRSDQRDHTGGNGWSWRYGVEGQDNFNTPMMANAGVLKTKSKYDIGADNTLTFWTWYDTEMDFWMDRKLVEVSIDGTNWQPVAWLAQFWPPMPPPEISQKAWDTLTMVPPMSWQQVDVSLADYAGQSIYIRFHFDSMDDWGNEGQGWFIDDISISGAGFQGQTVDVGADLTFSTQFTLAEGSNTISVTAARANYPPLLTGQASVTGSLDTEGPIIVLNPVTSPTNLSTQVLTGTITELNFDRLTVKVNETEQYSTTVLTENTTGVGTFVCTVTLTAGTNTILATATDDVGLSCNTTATIIYDADVPLFEIAFSGAQYDVAYKTGEVSARPGDWFFICLKVADNTTSVASVKLAVSGRPQSEWPHGIKVSEIPEAVIDSWGIMEATKTAMNYVVPMQLPSGTPAGDYSWTVKAWDTAGNIAELTPVATSVVTTLQAFNIYLMPDWNLISSPLIPTTANITTLTASINATGLFDRIWYYDASKAGTADEWVLYEPGVSSDLTTIDAGKGYWVKMKDLAAFTAAGKLSAPMASGLPNTPVPVKLTIAGQVLQPGAVVPPTYTVYTGWNLIGLHSEFERPVSTALSSVTVPQQIWGSLLQYLNYIYYPMGGPGGTPEIDLGRFDRLVSTDTMQPGRGFWLYMVQAGVIVP